ncbi:MAG: (2Fe-2S)-binding protein [bacterium]|nr:(2Fe-2S)-binding protein [bacterium]
MKINFNINGIKKELDLPPQKALCDVIREDFGFTGTKVGCREGECGACTVLMDGENVNSCLVPAISADGREIVTIEGIYSYPEAEVIRDKFMQHGAVQCGYCIPGMVISSYALLKKNPDPSENDIRTGLSGNLCRCTGYRKIIEAVDASAKELRRKAEEK